MTTPWLGHENGCSVQWGPICTCGPEDVDLSETPPEPRLQDELDRLERDDSAVAKASAGLDAVYRNVGGSLPLAQIRDIYDLDRPYETSLDEDERRGH